MYVTAQEVMDVTPYTDVTTAEVQQAQFVIEVYTGKLEGEVDGARDKGLLARATVAQCVYMRENPKLTFEQIGAQTIQAGGDMTVFKNDEAPFVAPLAVMACKHLSWKKSRSVHTGKTWQKGDIPPFWLFGQYTATPDGYAGVFPFDVEGWGKF
jgi:hypothetical protein